MARKRSKNRSKDAHPSSSRASLTPVPTPQRDVASVPDSSALKTAAPSPTLSSSFVAAPEAKAPEPSVPPAPKAQAPVAVAPVVQVTADRPSQAPASSTAAASQGASKSVLPVASTSSPPPSRRLSDPPARPSFFDVPGFAESAKPAAISAAEPASTSKAPSTPPPSAQPAEPKAPSTPPPSAQASKADDAPKPAASEPAPHEPKTELAKTSSAPKTTETPAPPKVIVSSASSSDADASKEPVEAAPSSQSASTTKVYEESLHAAARQPSSRPGNVAPKGKEHKGAVRSGGHEDVLHDEFFRQGEQVEREHMAAQAMQSDEEPSEAPRKSQHYISSLSPAALVERRKKLRRIVAYVLAPAALLALIVIVKVLPQTASGAASAVMASVSQSKPEPTPRVQPPVALATTARPVVTAPAAPTLSAKEDDPEPASAASASASAAASSALPPGVNPKKEAGKLLDQGKYKDAIRMAEIAISQEPEDAMPYLYLGTALQEMGKRAEAMKAYSNCVHAAKKGPVNECRAMGGR